MIDDARELVRQGLVREAEPLLDQLLADEPDHEEALYLSAVAKRYLKKHDEARERITRLQTLRPAYGRAFQEEGHLALSAGDLEGARRAFSNAVSRNDSLLASWKSLAAIAARANDRGLAERASFEVSRLEALPPQLLAVRNMISEGRLLKAEQLCRTFLKGNPQNVEGMRLLADLGVRTGVLDDAEYLLESAVEFEPDNAFARFDYVGVLYRLQKYGESLEQARILLDREPDNPKFQTAYANQCVAVGRFDEALEIYDDVDKKAPGDPMLSLLRGHVLKTTGQLDEAIEAYRNAYRRRADFGDAYWSLANLKTYSFTDDELRAMREAEKAPATSVEDRVHLCFALGKASEDAEAFDESMTWYERGNALRKDQIRYEGEKLSEAFEAQKSFCTRALFEKYEGAGAEAPDPIFVVGLPRAGSTLVEQILASHSKVDGTLELSNVGALAYRLDGRRHVDDEARYPRVLAELEPAEIRKFGEDYLEQTRIHRQGAPYFIDKMPNNFRHIGLIALMLPNAKIIDIRRPPMACCFSGFKQLFASGQEFSYSLTDIGRYYRDYVDLMAHWDRVLPGKVLRVHYEDLVADTESEVRRMLDYCGLDFEQACVEFYRTERSVRTPSSEQVRQPIYQTGLDHWRNFERHLDPLKAALGPALDGYKK